MKAQKMTLIFTILTLSIVLLTGCSAEEPMVSLEDQPVARAADIKTEATTGPKYVEVVAAETANSYQGVGSLKADKVVTISTLQAGTITTLTKEVGDFVKTGDLLAQVDTRNFELSIKNAKAQLTVAIASLKNAQNEYDRKKGLYEDGAIPSSTFDQITTALELASAQKQSAEVAVEMAEKFLKDTTTYANRSGVISKRFASRGEFIGDGKPLYQILVVDPVILSFSVPQHLAARLKTGLNVTATLSAYPGKSFSGIVERILPEVDARTRTLSLEARFENPESLLRPGFFANCSVELTAGLPAFEIPASAISTNEEGTFVTTSDGMLITVTVMEKRGSVANVVGDLQAGVQILANVAK